MKTDAPQKLKHGFFFKIGMFFVSIFSIFIYIPIRALIIFIRKSFLYLKYLFKFIGEFYQKEEKERAPHYSIFRTIEKRKSIKQIQKQEDENRKVKLATFKQTILSTIPDRSDPNYLHIKKDVYEKIKEFDLKLRTTTLEDFEKAEKEKRKASYSFFNVLVDLPFSKLSYKATTKVSPVDISYKGKKKESFGKYLNENFTGSHKKAQNNRVFIFFLFPSLFAFILIVIVPFIMGIYFSMTDWNGISGGDFVGLENYVGLFQDPIFLYSFLITALYSVLNIIVINVVAFGLALLVTMKLKLKNVYRAGFFMPNLIGGLVLGYIWQFIFNNAIPSLGGAFTQSIIAVGENSHPMLGLIIVVTWQYAGYIMMIYIAALQNVPQDLIEASKIDGANALQRLTNITFPLVAQAFTVSLFLTLVTSFKQFDTVVSLTAAGPAGLLPEWIANLYNVSATTSVKRLNLMAYNIYNSAYVDYELGVGQAKAIIFFIVLLGFSLLQVHFNKKREVEL